MSKSKYALIDDGSHVKDMAASSTSLMPLVLCCLLLGVVHFYTTSNYKFQQVYSESVNVSVTSSNASTTPSPKASLVPPSTTPHKYYVLTPHCRMPHVNPFAAKLPRISHTYRPCTEDQALVSANYYSNTRQYVLHLNAPVAEQLARKANSTTDDVSCCYRQIVRTGSGGSADTRFKLLPCSVFHQDFIVPTHINYIIVYCISKSKNKPLQTDAFSFIQYRNRQKARGPIKMHKKMPSVLMLGIDTLSRINVRRTMPATIKYLETGRWFELQGYNKVGDNTFPNLMAVLTDFNSSIAYKRCAPKSVGGLNRKGCNLIWNDFKTNGYRTAYAEDTKQLSTFNYLKQGFNAPPTDYYFRPMGLAIEKHLKVVKKDGLPFCIGRKHYGEYIYDFAVQFANVYPDEPIFGFFWTNSFSHNRYYTPASMDQKIVEYFETLEANGILERAIVIFFSDHGVRWGPLLNLPEGYFEERLPMFFISLPKWFKNEHPDLVAALEVNQHRLTSPYDIYMTLQHIMQLGDPDKRFPHIPGTVPGISIFKEIPENRTCSDAGITDHWCTCTPYTRVPKSSNTAKQITSLIIDEMNHFLRANHFTSVCNTLILHSVTDALLRIDDPAVQSAKNESAYRITYTTKPNASNFQATAIYNSHLKTVRVDVEEISRLNSYESTSKCIDIKKAKKFCICKK